MATQDELILQQYTAARKGLAQQKQAAQQEAEMGVNRQQALTGLSGGAAIKAREKAQQGLESSYSQAQTNLDSQQAQALQAHQAQLEQQAYGTSERLGGQQFQSEQAGLGRQFQTQERLGSQEFGAGQAQLGRQFQTGERLGGQEFSAGQAQAQRQYGTQERLGGQEFQAEQAGLGRQFQTGERTGTEQFQAGQTALERAQQASQFGQTFGLQQQQFQEAQRQFAEQMTYQWNEFSENQKTNMINAAVAFEKAGLDTSSVADLANLLGYIRETKNAANPVNPQQPGTPGTAPALPPGGTPRPVEGTTTQNPFQNGPAGPVSGNTNVILPSPAPAQSKNITSMADFVAQARRDGVNLNNLNWQAAYARQLRDQGYTINL